MRYLRHLKASGLLIASAVVVAATILAGPAEGGVAHPARPASAAASLARMSPDAVRGLRTICTHSNRAFCIQDEGCGVFDGNKIIVTQLVAGCASDFRFLDRGPVSASRRWPFTNRALDRKWHGREVAQLIYYIAGVTTHHGIATDHVDQAVLEASSHAADMVLDSLPHGRWQLIDVQVSDHFGVSRYLTAHLHDGNQAFFGTSGIHWDLTH
jgi:hypothetical protein